MNIAILLSAFLSITASAAEHMGPGHGVGGKGPPFSTFCTNRWHGIEMQVVRASGLFPSSFNLCRVEEAEISPMNIWHSLKSGGPLMDAYAAFLEHPSAQGSAASDPSDYCRFVGGTPETTKMQKNKIEVCTFEGDGGISDVSTIGLNTLFRGPTYIGNAQLVKILKGAKK